MSVCCSTLRADWRAFGVVLSELGPTSGKEITNGRFSTYEIDFLDDNFAGCTDCFSDVGAADKWYKGTNAYS